MKIAEHYQGTYGMFPTPEFVFHIGPPRDNRLNGKEDFDRRAEEVKQLLIPGTPGFTSLERALENAFRVRVVRLHAEVRWGGWKGTICPNLCLNSIRSTLKTGRVFYGFAAPAVGEKLCQSLLTELEADWIVCQHYFGKPFQVECHADEERG